MAQKPYKHNIEYIQKFYSPGTEAKVLELKPVYAKPEKPVLPKREKDPVTTICIDPVAFCGLMVAVVMLVVMLTGLIQFNVACDDHAVMSDYVNQLREDNVLLTHQYSAGYSIDEVKTTALALGMIPAEEAQTIRVNVVTPQRQPEPTWWDDMVWFLSGLLE